MRTLPLHPIYSVSFFRKVVDLSVIGDAVGALPGGAAVLCLAHDCLVEGAGGTEGLVRTDILLSAASAFVTLRRSIRAAKAGGGREEQGRGGGCDGGGSSNNAAPDNVGRGDGNPVPVAASEGKSVPETSTSSGSYQLDVSPGPDGGGSFGFGSASGPSSNRSSSGTVWDINPDAIAAVARGEVAVELDVYGDELCADLAEASTMSSASLSHVPAPKDLSKPPSQLSQQSCRTWRVRRAVEKHSALLSPQSVCALTALLSAKGKAWADQGNHTGDNVSAVDESGSRRHGDNEGSSPAGDPAAWKAVLADALLAVRVASLGHLSLWAAACDPGQLDSACVADVMALTKKASSSSPVGNVVVGDDAGAAAAVVEVGHVDEKEGGGSGGGGSGGIEAMWTALQKASGVGFSPLMLLAITLSDDDHCFSGDGSPFSLGASRPSSVVRGEPVQRSAVVGMNSDDVGGVDGAVDGGSTDIGSGSQAVSPSAAFIKSRLRSTLRLLSPNSLQSMAQCLSSQRRHSSEEQASSAKASATTQPEKNAGNASDQRQLVPENSGRGMLEGIQGHPAIGGLSRLDDETLKREAEGLAAALDPRGTGKLPPAVLTVALQSGEGGFRLELLQAQIVLRLAGAFRLI